MTLLRILASMWPGIFRILVAVLALTAAALGGAFLMAQKIAADERASDGRAEWVQESAR